VRIKCGNTQGFFSTIRRREGNWKAQDFDHWESTRTKPERNSQIYKDAVARKKKPRGARNAGVRKAYRTKTNVRGAEGD